jgi:hypothetical protein
MITPSSAYTAANASSARIPIYRLRKAWSYSETVLRDAPSLLLPLNDTSGTTAEDLSGNNLDGTYQNTPTLAVPGPLRNHATNRAVKFNGSDEYVTVADNALIDLGSNVFTLEIWVKPTSFADYGTLFDKGRATANAYRLGLEVTTGKLVLYENVSSPAHGGVIMTSSTGLDLNKWSHVVVTKNGSSSATMWLNGVDVSGSFTNRTINASSSDLEIGRRVGSSEYLAGSMAWAAIYPAVLSEARVKQHYHAGIAAFFSTHAFTDYKTEVLKRSPNLWLRLSEASGATAADSSGWGLDGAYQNAPTFGATGPLTSSSKTAVTLNGSDEYITVADNDLADPGDVLSGVAWVKMGAAGGTYTILSKGANGYQFLIDSSGNIVLTKQDVAAIVSGTTGVAQNIWSMVAFTKNGSTVKIYKDASDVTGVVSNQTIAATGTALNIGRKSSGSEYFNGTLAGVLLFPYALTAGDVRALYDAGRLLYHDDSTLPHMGLPSGIAAQIQPEKGSSSIENVAVEITDFDECFTQLLTEDINGAQFTLSKGFAAIQGEEFEDLFLGTLEACRPSQNFRSYLLTLRSPQSQMNKDAFLVSASKIEITALTDVATTVRIADSTDFQDAGYIRIESELISYTGRTDARPISPQAWNDITYGTEFVAVGDGVIARSTDGLHWFDVPCPEANNWTAVTCKSGLYVAVASNGTNRVMTSPDARNWTLRSAASAKAWADVAWASGLSLFVAVAPGDTAAVMTSADAITWTSRDASSNKNWSCVAYSPTIPILVAGSTNDGAMASSADGITWTDRTYTSSSGTAEIHSVIWASFGTPLFIAVGVDPGFTTTIYTSANGTSWTQRTAIDGPLHSVAFSSALSVAVAVGTLGDIVSSTNGTAWTSRTAAGDNTWHGVVASATAFVAVAQQGGVVSPANTRSQRSTDGTTWVSTAATLTGLTRGVDIGNVSTVAAAHATGVTVQEILRIGPDDPIDLLSDVLTGTDKEGMSISADLIDSAGLAAIQAQIGSGYQMEFLIDAKQNGKTFVESEFCQALGLYPIITGNGKQSFRKFTTPVGGDSVADIDDDVVQEDSGRPLISLDLNFQSVINSVVFQYDHNVMTGEYQSTAEFTNAASIVKYGRKSLVLTSRGFKSHLTGTLNLMELIADEILDRYANAAPLVEATVFLSKHTIEPGDVVSVTSSVLPNRSTGTLGITDEPMEVIRRRANFADGKVDLTMLWPGWAA